MLLLYCNYKLFTNDNELSTCVWGSLSQGRDHLTPEKERFAHEHAQMKSLEDVVQDLKPTAIIGNDLTL